MNRFLAGKRLKITHAAESLKFSTYILDVGVLFCLLMRDIDRERQRHGQREKQAPCGEPNAGLDPGIAGSCPEPRADAQPPRHPSIYILERKHKLSISEAFVMYFFYLFFP